MKKTMKRLAAITATMMTVSALSSISVFADPTIETEHYTEGGNSQNASVSLQAKISSVETPTAVGNIDSSKNDSTKHIWNVTISTNTLQWDIVRTDTTYNYQNITWDADNHVYTSSTGAIEQTVSAYSLAQGETEAKTFNIKNDSNFAITSETTISPEENNYGAAFTATNPQGNISINGEASTTITIDIDHMSNFNSNSYVTLGTANITLMAVENSIQEYNPSGNNQSGS
jgi:hypothetical protein